MEGSSRYALDVFHVPHFLGLVERFPAGDVLGSELVFVFAARGCIFWVVLRVMRIECPHALLQAPEVDVVRRVRFVKFAEQGALVPHGPAVACVPTVEDTVHLRHAGDDNGGHNGGALGRRSTCRRWLVSVRIT